MKHWKVVKKVYGNDTYYYVYRRWFLFFWTYMYMETPEKWNYHVKTIENGGHTVNEFCYTVNF